MTVRAAWLTNRTDVAGGQTRHDSRTTPLGTMTPAGEMTSVSGVVPGGDPLAPRVTGPMSIEVTPGRALIQGSDVQGAYPVAVTEAEPLTLTDGDPTNPRIDLVILRVYDAAHDDTGDVRAAAEIIIGTPAAAPEVPPTPVGALPLYSVTVPTGASAGSGGIDFPNVTTDLRTTTVAVGGIPPATTGDGAYRGQYRDNLTGLQRWTGSTWAGIVTEVRAWTKVTLASGYGHNGNNQGDVRYRVIDLIGTRHVQWRGGMTVTYSGGAPPRDGEFLTAALPANARPDSLRSMSVACSAISSNDLALKADFRTSGVCALLSRSGSTPPWVSLNGLMYPL